MHYTSEFAVNMNKGSSVMPGTGARMHESTHVKDRLIEHTMRTEFNDYVGSSVNPREAKGVIGDSNHKLNFKFPEGNLKFKDRKSTRLNSSHTVISYAVFCLKKKKKKNNNYINTINKNRH